jgi:hypothetical protein
MNTFKIVMAIAMVVMFPVSVGANAWSDPTQPIEFRGTSNSASRVVAGVPAGPVLESTLISLTHRSAMISGKRVAVGDTFDGAIVKEIAAYEVRMSKGGREIALRLTPKLIKEIKEEGVTE